MGGLLFGAILLFSSPSLAFRAQTEDMDTINECHWNQQYLESSVDCNDTFHHYLPKIQSEQGSSTQNLRVGSYNIFRTSQQKGNKNLPLTAQMIDKSWDILALAELQPGSTSDVKMSFRTGKYIIPAYLELLLELRKLDPSWGLLLSPYAQGSDAELLGFLYRSSRIQPEESQYCRNNYTDNPPYSSNFVYRELNQNGIEFSDFPINPRDYVLPENSLACPLALTGLENEFFIKVPFSARFRSGNFSFNMVILHLSFRGIDEFDSQCMGDCQLQNLKVISSLDGDQNNDVTDLIDSILNGESNSTLDSELDIAKIQNVLDISKTNIPGVCSSSVDWGMDCQQRMRDWAQYITEKGLVVPSCQEPDKFSSNDDLYDICSDEYSDARRDAYSTMIEELLNKVVTPLIDQGPYSNIVRDIFDDLTKDNSISRGEGRELARFYQTYATMKAAQIMKEVENSEDVIVSGDFNLEMEFKPSHWRYKMWEHALDQLLGAELHVEDKTSLNSKRGLSKNYDHFIFSPSETDECSTSSVHVLNYLTSSLLVEHNGEEKTLADAVDDEDYWAVLSDHLPIGMECKRQ